MDPKVAATDWGHKQGVLLEYEANTLGSPIFTSKPLGLYPRFNAPTIANGRVYVPTFDNGVVVLGMRPAGDEQAPILEYLLREDPLPPPRPSIVPVLNLLLNSP